MKVIINKKEVLKSFANMQSIVERNNIIPILSSLLMDAKEGRLFLYATNLKISLIDECSAVIEKEGTIALDAKRVYEIIKEAPNDEIVFEEKENTWVKISSGKIVYNLPGNNPQEYPERIKIKEKDPSIIMAPKLLEMVRKTAFAIAEDEGKGSIGALFWEIMDGEKKKLRLVATDAHRLSCIEREKGDKEQFTGDLHAILVPKKGVMELRKLLEDAGDEIIKIWKENENLLVKRDNTVLAIRLMEGEFPDYKKVLSFKGAHKIKLSTTALLDVLRRVSIVLEERLRIIKATLSAGVIRIVAHNSETGEAKEEMGVDYQGDEKEINLNLRYLWDSLNCLNDETFFLEMRGPTEPIRILPEKDVDHVLIVMPMVF